MSIAAKASRGRKEGLRMIEGKVVGREVSGEELLSLEAVVHCNPIPWKRPGQSKHGRYDIQKNDKVALGCIFNQLTGNHKAMTGKICLHAIFGLPKPKLGKGGELHAVKPDLDNLVKFFLDAGNGILWRDDSEICEMQVKKIYADFPGVYFKIHLKEVEDEEGKEEKSRGNVELSRSGRVEGSQDSEEGEA